MPSIFCSFCGVVFGYGQMRPIMTTKNKGPVYPNLKPWSLEPHYHKHIGAMTSEDLQSKAAIAEQLAWRDKTIKSLEDIINRTLNCGQLDKLVDAKAIIHAHNAGEWYFGWPEYP